MGLHGRLFDWVDGALCHDLTDCKAQGDLIRYLGDRSTMLGHWKYGLDGSGNDSYFTRRTSDQLCDYGAHHRPYRIWSFSHYPSCCAP